MKHYKTYLLLSITLIILTGYGGYNNELIQSITFALASLIGGILALKAASVDEDHKSVLNLLGISLLWNVFAEILSSVNFFLHKIRLNENIFFIGAYFLTSVGIAISAFILYFKIRKKISSIQLRINMGYSCLIVCVIILQILINTYQSGSYLFIQLLGDIAESSIALITITLCMSIFLSSQRSLNTPASFLLLAYTLYGLGDLVYVVDFTKYSLPFYSALGSILKVSSFCLFGGISLALAKDKINLIYNLKTIGVRLENIFAYSLFILVFPASLILYGNFSINYLVIVLTMSITYQLVSYYNYKANAAEKLAQEQESIQVDLENEIKDKLEYIESINEQLRRQVTQDSLTPFKNRNYLNEFLSEPHFDEKNICLVYIDLDNFKHINDTYGHNIGDKVIIKAAEKINTIQRPHSFFCRVGGDEFVFVAKDIEKNQIKSICEAILKEIETPFVVSDKLFSISASMGISTYPKDSTFLKSILKNAESAMYISKSEKYGSKITFYDESQDTHSKRLNILESLINNCLPHEQLSVLFRPIYDLEKNLISSFDAKIDWSKLCDCNDEKEILGILEKSPRFHEIFTWLIESIGQQLAYWNNMYSSEFKAHIKPPIQTFNITNVEKTIIDALALSELSTNSIIIDIDERTIENLIKNNNNALQKLVNNDIHICLTNFGTGYTALCHLKNFHFDHIKINKNFVKDIDEQNQDGKIYAAIVQMARTFSGSIISTGLSSKEQLKLVSGYDVDEAEGPVVDGFISPKTFEKKISKGFYQDLNRI